MRLHLVLFMFFSHRQLLPTVVAFAPLGKPSVNQTNPLIDMALYQCDTNKTNWTNYTTNQDAVKSNLIDSCNVSCCPPSPPNRTSTRTETPLHTDISLGVFSVFRRMPSDCPIPSESVCWSSVLFWHVRELFLNRSDDAEL